MTDIIENPLLEHMKRFHAGQDRIEHTLDELLLRVGHLEVSVVGLRRVHAHSDEYGAALSLRLDRVNERLDRIERRLELAS